MEVQQRANIGKRFLASFIDYVIIACISINYILLFGEPDEYGNYTVSGLNALVPFVFWFVYLVVIETFISATFGHFLLGMKVVKTDNGRINFIEALKRHLIDPVDFTIFGIPAMICIKNTALSQRIGDLWAETVVINDNKKNSY